MIEQLRVPPLPGAVGVTHLKVYDTRAPDGLLGGSPHMHFACTEAYMVLAGRGAVQTLGAAGLRELPLEPGRLVWFTPGLIHRLINLDGRLEIMVLMQNAGLPEAGDFVLTFAPEILADEQAYFAAASLAPTGHVYTDSEAAAKRRRDLAVDGFAVLRERSSDTAARRSTSSITRRSRWCGPSSMPGGTCGSTRRWPLRGVPATSCRCCAMEGSTICSTGRFMGCRRPTSRAGWASAARWGCTSPKV